MSFDLSNLANLYKFNFESETLGKILAAGFTAKDLAKAENWLRVTNISADAFIRKFTTLVCQIDKNGTSEYTEEVLTESESSKLTANDLDNFSKLFISKNPNLLKNNENTERTITTNKSDRKSASIKKTDDGDLQKKKDETNCQHLKRLIENEITTTKKRNQDLFDRVTGRNIFPKSTIDLINENRRLSNNLGNSLYGHEQIVMPKFPENPTHETNRIIKELGVDISQVSSLIKNMNDLAVQLAVNSKKSSTRTKIWNNIMFVLGLITLIVSASFSYLSYTSSNESFLALQSTLAETNSYIVKQAASQEMANSLSSDLLNEIQETNSKLTAILDEQQKYNHQINRTENTSAI